VEKSKLASDKFRDICEYNGNEMKWKENAEHKKHFKDEEKLRNL
jgi:hypothetical protein